MTHEEHCYFERNVHDIAMVRLLARPLAFPYDESICGRKIT